MGMGYGRGVWGYGRGAGGGRGWRNMYYATGLPAWARGNVAPPAPAPEQEMADLKAQAAQLAESLDAIQRRIEELGGGAAPADM